MVAAQNGVPLRLDAALAHQLAGVRHAGEQRRHALEHRDRGEHARVERIGTGTVLHRSQDTDRVGRQPSSDSLIATSLRSGSGS